ncbi:MAG: hypothetical protein ACR2L2_03440 [Acidobacteriota bacterium]
MNPPSRAAIWLKTVIVIAGYVMLIWLGHRLFLSRYITNVLLSVAVAFTALQFFASAVIVSALSITRRLAQIRSNRAQ